MRVALIPARGGSVRVPRKNVRDFCGKPMLAYPIEAAKASGLFDLIVVSTDDAEIAAAAFNAGAVVMPRATDDGSTGTQEIAGQVLDALDADGLACVIYPCTPLLTPELLQWGAEMLARSAGSRYAYSVTPDLEDAGCFYFGRCIDFRARTPLDDAFRVLLPAQRAIDINTEADMARAETMFYALRRAP